MVDNGLTKTYTLRLTFESPAFLGSGTKISKKEYFYNTRKHTVTFYDSGKLMRCILENDLIDAYEVYMLGSGRTLYDFFHENGGTKKFQDAVKYQVSSGNAIQVDGRQPADILTHVRSGAGNVYVPGSSVKGMLRTAVTVGCILRKMPNTQKPFVPAHSSTKKAMKAEADTRMRELDEELFHTLKVDSKKISNAVNSLFRGVSIADSPPIPDNTLILCRKLDVFPNGNRHELNLVRECIGPGTTVTMPITFDPSLAQFITPEFIVESIQSFDNWYTAHVFSHYQDIQGLTLPALTQHLFLGGGSGYPTKTVTAPWLQDDAPHAITVWLTTLFGKKNARDDENYGISPHMLKYTTVNERKMPFGLCKVEIL